MAINLKTTHSETREQRLGTITHWEGSADQLARDSRFYAWLRKGVRQRWPAFVRAEHTVRPGFDVRREYCRY